MMCHGVIRSRDVCEPYGYITVWFSTPTCPLRLMATSLCTKQLIITVRS